MGTRVRNFLVALTGFICVSSYSMGALAKEFLISRSTDKVDGSKINPGDTLTLQAGTRDGLTIKNLVGTRDRPILIRNDFSASEPVTMRRTRGIKITATVNGDSPTVFLRLGGFSTNITVRGVEVDGRWPKVGKGWAGFKLDDVTIKSEDHRGVWRENVVLEQNYVHHTMREGFYIGPICCGPEGTDTGAPTRTVGNRGRAGRDGCSVEAGAGELRLTAGHPEDVAG